MKKIPLIVATKNAHKAKEIARILPPQYELHTLDEYPGIPDPVEDGTTFAANAAIKAEAVSACVPGLVVADDSGICVDLLNGAPGVMSARFCGEHGQDEENNRKLLRELAALPGQAPYRAHYACAISLAENGHQIASFLGTVEGQITLNPAGTGGFGYDPLFIPDGFSNRTMAQLTPQEKDSISHRARALQKLARFLAERGN